MTHDNGAYTGSSGRGFCLSDGWSPDACLGDEDFSVPIVIGAGSPIVIRHFASRGSDFNYSGRRPNQKKCPGAGQ